LVAKTFLSEGFAKNDIILSLKSPEFMLDLWQMKSLLEPMQILQGSTIRLYGKPASTARLGRDFKRALLNQREP